jgi:hypothetical protein
LQGIAEKLPWHLGTLARRYIFRLSCSGSHSWTEARRNNFAETIIFSQDFDGYPTITGFFSKVCPGGAGVIRWLFGVFW